MWIRLTAGLLGITAACGADDDPVFVDAVDGLEESSGSSTTSEQTSIVPSATTTVDLAPVVVDRAWSPENAIAELVGSGADPSDPLTVDGTPADVESFEASADGGVVARVRIVDEGAHTVCVRDTCRRVFTRAGDAESNEEIAAKVAAARPLAAELFDGESIFAGWTIASAGPLAGTGGTTNIETNRTGAPSGAPDADTFDFVASLLPADDADG